MTQRCPAVYETEEGEESCLSLHPTEQSLAMHLYKTDDDAHGEWDDYDETLREVFSEDYEMREHPSGLGVEVDDGGDLTPPAPDADDGDKPEESDADELEEPSPTAADGGGPRTPPEPELPDEPEEEETVPDHLVPVEEFVADAEDDLPDELTDTDEWEEFAAELRDDPEGFVDLQASNVETGEVRTTDA